MNACKQREALAKKKKKKNYFSNYYENFKSKGSGWVLIIAFVPIVWYEKGGHFLC